MNFWEEEFIEKFNMNTYMFFTTEGYTEAPNGEPVENVQLLGRIEGSNVSEALDNFLQINPWILEYGFKKDKIYVEQILE